MVYWFWSRRPTTSDTVGVFRRELRVLEGATPTRVPPANRRCTGDLSATPATSVALAATALCHKRTEVRRRRRDVLSVLVAAVAVSVVAAALTRSRVAFGTQAACDLALVCYVCLLVKAARSRGWAHSGLEVRTAPGRLPRAAAGGPLRPSAAPPVPERAVEIEWPSAPARHAPAVPVARARRPRREPAPYLPAHGFSRTVAWSAGDDGAGSYGDFDSYASLALASAP